MSMLIHLLGALSVQGICFIAFGYRRIKDTCPPSTIKRSGMNQIENICNLVLHFQPVEPSRRIWKDTRIGFDLIWFYWLLLWSRFISLDRINWTIGTSSWLPIKGLPIRIWGSPLNARLNWSFKLLPSYLKLTCKSYSTQVDSLYRYTLRHFYAQLRKVFYVEWG